MKTLGLVSTLVILGAAFHAQASPICPAPPTPSGAEGDWRIPEEAFTEAVARDALAKLEQLLGPDGVAVDPGAWETHFVYLEGWYLKRQALEALSRGAPEPSVTDFCEFLRDRAYVRH